MRAVAETFRRLGFTDSLYYFASLVLARGSRGQARIVRYHLVAQPVPPGVPPRPGRVIVTEVKPGDPIIASFPRRPAVIERRFAGGAICLAAQEEGRFAGYLWLRLGPYDEDEVRCRYVTAPPERTAWDFDVYVEPAYRMGRTFARLWAAAHALLRDRGVEWTMSRISAFNAESLRSHARLGLTRLRTVTFLRAGSVQVLLSPASPWLHLSAGSASIPTLYLEAPASGRDAR